MSNSIKLAILGLGTVGTGVINLINDNLNELKRRSGRDIIITEVGTRRHRDDIDPNIMQNNDLMATAASDNVDIVVEVIGGTTLAKDVIMHAIKNGKHVVTANKALLAEHGNEIFAFAEEHNVHVAYEAAVAGGIPIIKVMREALAANKIDWLAGIINGTGNFIMTEMRDKGRPFADVLTEAQELGYAEADPTFDVEGIDAAHIHRQGLHDSSACHGNRIGATARGHIVKSNSPGIVRRGLRWRHGIAQGRCHRNLLGSNRVATAVFEAYRKRCGCTHQQRGGTRHVQRISIYGNDDLALYGASLYGDRDVAIGSITPGGQQRGRPTVCAGRAGHAAQHARTGDKRYSLPGKRIVRRILDQGADRDALGIGRAQRSGRCAHLDDLWHSSARASPRRTTIGSP